MATRMKGGARRASIVDAAVHLFAEKGFRGATTRELASALGVTEPILYQHFETKNDLYRAIIESKTQEGDLLSAQWESLLVADDDRAFFEVLGNLILRRYDEDPDFMRLLLFSALERHELADLFFDRFLQEFYQAVSGYIERRMDAGAFRRMDPRTAALGFVGMMNYHGQLRLLFSKRVPQADREKVVGELVETFLSGLGATPSS